MITDCSPPLSVESVEILGVPIARVTMAETLAIIDQFVASGEPHLLVTADAAGLAQASSDRDLFAVYRSADLVTPDSEGVMWAANRCGKPMKERVSGVDILEQVCANGAQTGHRIYFLGAAPGVAAEAAKQLSERFPGCKIVGSRDGFFSPDQDELIAREVAAAKPDILFVGMGIPRQEKFIQATKSIIRAKVGIGVGGSFDVHSGRIKRAPLLIRQLHLEWLWRTASNPKKIKKAANLPKFVMLILKGQR